MVNSSEGSLSAYWRNVLYQKSRTAFLALAKLRGSGNSSSVRYPLRKDLAGLRLGEVDEDLLPVRFVVVGAEKVAPPVIERVEEPVLQDDPARLPNHATVVLVVFLFLHQVAVHDARSLHAFSRHPTSEQQS